MSGAGAGGTAAIVLAGGRGTRLGGADKAALLLDGATLLQRALRALEGVPTVVVGPDRDPVPRPGVVMVREDPPFSGPAAAVAAGLAALPAEARDVLLLAVDVPGLPTAAPLLLAADGAADGVVAVDADGREQWLLGRYRVAALRAGLDALGPPAGRPVRALLGGLALARLRLPPGLEQDVDTVADAARAGAVLPAAADAETEARPEEESP